ncbi:MAG: signal peptidase [Bacteroidota bacterium]|jgi:signal peptidase I
MSNVTNDQEAASGFGDRLKQATTKQWIKFLIIAVLCVFFVLWTGYFLILLLVPLFFDSYITKYIPWSFWKKSKNAAFRKFMEWVDAIGFALVAVYIINTFFFQNYQIPSSSLEKSLLVGDFLFVSKMSYGTRSPMTPFSFPLAQHTLPVLNTKSYIDKPQIGYQRFTGFGSIERGDIVVFNFPAGDTVALNQQAEDYYSLAKKNKFGRAGLWNDKHQYGDIVYRPVDRRENYVKRCMGLPGETIEIRNDEVYIDGQKVESSKNIQLRYNVQTDGTRISEKVFEALGLSKEDYMIDYGTPQETPYFYDLVEYMNQSTPSQGLDFSSETKFKSDSLHLTQLGFVAKGQSFGITYNLPLTQEMVNALKSKPFVMAVVKEKEQIQKRQMLDGNVIDFPFYYPINYTTRWTRDNYGPLWIPKRGTTIKFDTDIEYKVAAYERVIKNYEGNQFEYKNGKVYINGNESVSYTFRYDYFFMMGDNRHNSADSRSWGFVPEDHIVGRPLFVWLSLNKDKGWFDGKIRWNRIFTSAKKN